MKTINEYDWSRIHGAYGPVPSLPGRIADLASLDSGTAEGALRWLSDNLIHQGTVWQVTPLAIPYLIQTVERLPASNRSRIAELILYLAVKANVPPIPSGFDPETRFAGAQSIAVDQADLDLILASTDWDRLDDRLWNVINSLPLRWEHETYAAVENGSESIENLATDPDPAVRRIAYWFFGWFPRRAEFTIKHLRNALDRETDPYLLANAIIVLGLTARYLGDHSDVARIEEYLTGQSPRILTRSASLALVSILGTSIPGIALDILIQGTEDDENLKSDTAGLGWPWNAPSLKGCYWRAIHALGL